MLITQDGQTPVVGLLEDFLKSLVQVSTTRAFPYSAELSQEKGNN